MCGMPENGGRRFVCRQCGNCCRWKGYVFLDNAEIPLIASYLGLSLTDFTDAYTDLAPDRRCLVLKCTPEGACCFLDGRNRCRIHEVKPFQCKSYPYLWSPTPEQAGLCQGQWVEED